ncbi:MAG: protein kinase [Pyrinomonadaceae bacterium]|nr:protein kinase [Pyrinomonadaceae bacterium]
MLDNLQHGSGGQSAGNRGVAGSLRAGQFLKHYRVIDKIGQGGMGRIYKAEDTKLGRRVAIKLLPEEATRDAKAKLRLLREARSASALNHPSIVTIHAIDDAEGLDFIVIEYVEGETLSAAVARRGARVAASARHRRAGG